MRLKRISIPQSDDRRKSAAPHVLWAMPLLVLSGTGDSLARAGSETADTHEFTAPAPARTVRWLALSIVDDGSGRSLAARFHLEVNGAEHVPDAIGPRGLRLAVRHHKKGQRSTALYTRGEGSVIVPLPDRAREGTITVSRGYEYLATRAPFVVDGPETRLTLRLRRWLDLPARGWYGADAHLHFDRLDPATDSDWLTATEADGLSHGHFLTLKGGNLPGLWARQYAHGPAGQAGTAVTGWIRPGTEYRDRLQGHISLLGPTERIDPVSTGGLGDPPVAENFPPLHDVMVRSRSLGGLTGIAHGNALGRQPTGLLDAVLGAVDFVEIANTHRLELEAWYLLLNCGIVLPPAGGTDLPNNPFRDSWQPLLGETRMYVKSAEPPDFAMWKQAVLSGAVVVSSGPWLELDVAGVGPGGTVTLPPGGGDVRVTALLESPRPPQAVEVVHDGRVVKGRTEQRRVGGVHRWRVSRRIRVAHSGWIAARATGARKAALAEHTGIRQRAAAHTAVVRVLVGDEPIRSPAAVRQLRTEIRRLRAIYRRKGTYRNTDDRDHTLALFDRAIVSLQTDNER